MSCINKVYTAYIKVLLCGWFLHLLTKVTGIERLVFKCQQTATVEPNLLCQATATTNAVLFSKHPDIHYIKSTLVCSHRQKGRFGTKSKKPHWTWIDAKPFPHSP